MGEALKGLVVTITILHNNISDKLQDGAVAPNEVPHFGGYKNYLWLKVRMIVVHVQISSLCFKRFLAVCNLLLIKEANAVFLSLLKNKIYNKVIIGRGGNGKQKILLIVCLSSVLLHSLS